MGTDWNGKRVLVLGAARQGQAAARYLARHGARVTINDRRSAAEMQAAQEALADVPLTWVLGGHPLELLAETDLLCLSGGVPMDNPLVAEALQRGLPLTNDTQLFMEVVPCPTIGITGSAGKTTTTTLVGRMAHSAVAQGTGLRRAWVGGNIGDPLLKYVDDMRPDDLAILEISSFQLEQMTLSPNVAAVLNVTPNHLDRHGSMAAYLAAKARILDFQAKDDHAILGREDAGAWGLRTHVRARLSSFGLRPLPPGEHGTYQRAGMFVLQHGEEEEELFEERIVLLRGEHNRLNVLAACAIAAAAGLSRDAMQAGVEGFGGVPHRLEFVREWHGARWYNDSIATAPERTMAAIRSFEEPLILLLGGRDKDLPWDDLTALVRQRVEHVILFGEAATKIAAALERAQGPCPKTLERCERLEDAVRAAARLARPGFVILLSPGATSFDEFRDFEERGEWFCQWVRQLS